MQLGIECKADLPNVGKNLQDQVQVPLVYKTFYNEMSSLYGCRQVFSLYRLSVRGGAPFFCGGFGSYKLPPC